MGTNRQSDFKTLADVARWNSLYGQNVNEDIRCGRWAIFQSYAQQRTLHRLSLCVNLVESYDGKNVLDLACGSAQYGVAVTERGGKWFGMDISRQMLLHAKRLLKNRGHDGQFVNGDIAHLPLSESSFDVIFSIGILSYFPNHKVARILSELPALLRPRGFLILQTIRLDVLTWLRSRLPGWVPRPIRLPGPLYPRGPRAILQQLEGSSVRLRKVIETKKCAVLPFQTIYLFQKEADAR